MVSVASRKTLAWSLLNLGLWRSLSSLAARGGVIKDATTAREGGGVISLDTGAGGGSGCCTSGITVESGTGGNSGNFTLLGASEATC
jgi:hypothetical protein